MQPPHATEGVFRDYARDFQHEDRVAWRALAEGRAVRSSDLWEDSGAFESTRFYTAFLRPAGLAYVMAAPLRSPLLEGYPGVIWVARSREVGDFSEQDLRALAELAEQVDEASRRVHGAKGPRPSWSHQMPSRIFVFDAQLQQRLPEAAAGAGAIDARLLEEMRQTARQRLQRVNGEFIASDRVPLPDSRGDLWTFRAITFKRLPALGDGPFVVFCLNPECRDWSNIHPADLSADSELSRLVPSIHFMQDEFRRGPTLGAIAKTVHLSPFHFHRRFSELFGQTPKHFLLECQIYAAKEELAAREKDLAKIATDCGFAHQSHFTSRFKQATGLTPTRWRRIATGT